MNLELQQISRDDHILLRLSGELDAYTAPQLNNQLLELVSVEGSRIMVDLAEVSYMDSTGIGVFIGALKATKKNGSHMMLLNPQARIERLFAITGLSEVMEIRQEEESR